MVDDEELDKLREERKNEIEEQSGESGDAVEQQREQIRNLASKYLTKDARERLGNIRAAKPELASAVETQIAQLGRMGQIDKLDDDQLKNILKEVQKSDEDNDIKFRR